MEFGLDVVQPLLAAFLIPSVARIGNGEGFVNSRITGFLFYFIFLDGARFQISSLIFKLIHIARKGSLPSSRGSLLRFVGKSSCR